MVLKGKKPWNYRGITDKISFCVGCGKKVGYNYIRCPSCAKKGKLNPLYGKKRVVSAETREKLRIAKTGQKCPQQSEWMKIHKPHLGHKHSKETKALIGALAKERYKNSEDNPNYKHGRGNDPYPLIFSYRLKNKIKGRDNYRCLNCGISEEEHLKLVGTKLHIHHVDYDKTNIAYYNLATTCRACNMMANSDRDFWMDIYQRKLISYI